MDREIISQLRSTLSSAYDRTFLRPYLSFFGHQAYQRFAVIGHARTGSNYLLSGLKSSKHVRVYHEIFADHNREIGKDFDQIFSVLFQKESRNTRFVGFKLFYNHLTEDEWEKFLSHKDFKIIHLIRENRLRTIVSLDIAFKTGQWTKSTRAKHRRPAEKMVWLDTSNLIDRLERIQDYETLTRERFRDRQTLEVVYEQLAKNPRQTFRRVGEYLGVNDIDPGKIRLTRQNPESLERLIVNYVEVRQLLKNTRFAQYVDG